MLQMFTIPYLSLSCAIGSDRLLRDRKGLVTISFFGSSNKDPPSGLCLPCRSGFPTQLREDQGDGKGRDTKVKRLRVLG